MSVITERVASSTDADVWLTYDTTALLVTGVRVRQRTANRSKVECVISGRPTRSAYGAEKYRRTSTRIDDRSDILTGTDRVALLKTRDHHGKLVYGIDGVLSVTRWR